MSRRSGLLQFALGGAGVLVLAAAGVGAFALVDGSGTGRARSSALHAASTVRPSTKAASTTTTPSTTAAAPTTVTTTSPAPSAVPPTSTLGANGRLPQALLVTITPECEVIAEIAGPLRQLLADANAQGVGLAPERQSFLPPGTPGPPQMMACYRSYEMQQWWRDYYCSVGKCGLAAVPGTSRHGWSHAVDFQDQLGEMTFDSPGYHWLVAHAAAYGFYHPAWADAGSSSAEPWHWEHD